MGFRSWAKKNKTNMQQELPELETLPDDSSEGEASTENLPSAEALADQVVNIAEALYLHRMSTGLTRLEIATENFKRYVFTMTYGVFIAKMMGRTFVLEEEELDLIFYDLALVASLTETTEQRYSEIPLTEFFEAVDELWNTLNFQTRKFFTQNEFEHYTEDILSFLITYFASEVCREDPENVSSDLADLIIQFFTEAAISYQRAFDKYEL